MNPYLLSFFTGFVVIRSLVYILKECICASRNIDIYVKLSFIVGKVDEVYPNVGIDKKKFLEQQKERTRGQKIQALRNFFGSIFRCFIVLFLVLFMILEFKCLFLG
jgi:hypothetical protein